MYQKKGNIHRSLKRKDWAGLIAQLAEYWPSLQEALCLIPSTWEGEAGESEVPSHPRLHREFQASLSYMGPCLTQTKPRTKPTKINSNEGSQKDLMLHTDVEKQVVPEKPRED